MKDKHDIFSRIFYPLATVATLILIVATIVNAIFGFYTHDSYVRTELWNTTEYLAQCAQSNPDKSVDILKIAFKNAADNPALRLTLLDSKGRVILDSDSQLKGGEDRWKCEEVVSASEGKAFISNRISSVSGREVLFAAYPIFETGNSGNVKFIVRAALPQFDAEFDGWTTIMRNLGMGAAVICSILIAMFVLAQVIAKKADNMKEYAKATEHGGVNPSPFCSNILQFDTTAKSISDMARNMDRRMITLNKRSSELSEIFANMKECVFICNADGRFLKMNAAAGLFFGVDEGGVRDRIVEKIIFNRSLLEFINATFKSGETAAGSIEFPENGGKTMNVTGAILPYDAKAKRAVFVMNDITEIRALEKMRRNFVAGVSHELKTPITSVKGFVEALRDTSDDAEKDRILDIISKESDRMNSLVDDMLLLSKLEHAPSDETKDFEDIKLKLLLIDTANNYSHIAKERKIEISLVCPDDMTIRGNRKLVALSISNLISNALKHSPENTKIEIRAEIKANSMEISVRDNGEGIAPEHLSHIFERFYRVDTGRAREVGGTGLGLALVKHIAILHGATVTAESKVGVGSIFRIIKKF